MTGPSWLRRKEAPRPPSVKATIYLGPELSERIARLRARGIDINVSAVCQAALEGACAQAEAVAL